MGEIRRNGGLQDPALPASIPPHHFIRIELGQMMGKGLAGGLWRQEPLLLMEINFSCVPPKTFCYSGPPPNPVLLLPWAPGKLSATTGGWMRVLEGHLPAWQWPKVLPMHVLPPTTPLGWWHTRANKP